MVLRLVRQALVWITFLLITAFVMINVHEIGHTLVAFGAGDRHASYHLYQRYSDDGYCIGCNVYHEAVMSDAGIVWTNLGGVMFTQACVIAALVYLRFSKRPRYLWFWVAGIGIFLLGDGLYQAVQGLAATIGPQTALSNVDVAHALYVLHHTWHYPVTVLKCVAAGLTAAYIAVVIWCLRTLCIRHVSQYD